MSENLINQYGRTELSLRLAYIKIYLHAGFFFFVLFFKIKDQTRNIIRNLTPYLLHYSKSDAIFVLVFFTTVESRQQFFPHENNKSNYIIN